MNWKDFEKTWHQSKKFLAFLVMEVLLGGLTFYMMFRAASEVVSWQTTSVLFVLIFNMGFIAVAFNVGQAKRLEDYVHGAMLTLGVKRVETPNFVATIAETGGAVVVDDEDNFIAEYAKVDTLVRVTKEMFDLYYSESSGYASIVCNIPYSRLTLHPFIRNKLEINKKAVSEFLKSSGKIEGARLVKGTSLRVK